MERYSNALLIAGTDVGVGKTVLATALSAYWHTYCTNRRLGILQPAQSGGTAASQHYSRLFPLNQSPEELTPLHFEGSLPIPIAAQRAGRRVALEKAWQTFEMLSQQRDFVLVETQGGLGSPLTLETTMADLAWDWRLPTVLVVPVQRGAVGQAVANAALAQQSRVYLKGIVLNCVQPGSEAAIADWASPDLIESLTQKPILGSIPHLRNTNDLTKLTQAASNLDLERLLPL